MDVSLKELDKLEKLTTTAVKSKTNSVDDSLDGLLVTLRDLKQRLEAGSASENDVENISRVVEERKKDVDDRQKEIYASLTRLGKVLDKKFVNPVPVFSPLFTSESSQEALQRTIALHFFRTGQFSTAQTFIDESGTNIPNDTQAKFVGLHYVLTALRSQDSVPALEWCEKNRDFLERRRSPLEFYLHRSQYMRLLLTGGRTSMVAAREYARDVLCPIYHKYPAEIHRLTACVAFLPKAKLARSPYADLASPTLHQELEPMFAKEYCASLGMSRQVPLRVVCDIGGGGALARIEKGKKVMKERKSEWSQMDELPIEISLPPENRYHSVFACPVSKEQASTSNPPMMLHCGHVVAKDSLQKLAKSQGRVKCPYCPQETNVSLALEVHF